MAVKPGQMLDRYKMIELIGSGAFGGVWLAEDSWLSKRVALKIPHNQTMDFSKLIAEPKMLAALEHPNIIKLLTVEKASDTLFMVMEYVEGENLRDRLKGGPLPVPEALDIIWEILEALAYAHQKGVVHRDLKPGNILITPQDQIKITDFGTAHALQAGEETVAAGTLFYMSKEQLMGHVTPASDLYSVGVLLFEMLTGKLPFYGETSAKVMQKILSNDPPPDATSLNPEIPAALSAIISRALDKDLKRRWQMAEEMLEALEAFKAGRPIPGVDSSADGSRTKPLEAMPAPSKPPSRKVLRLADTFGSTHEYVLQAEYGERGKGEGQFMLPNGVAVDGTGRILVTDAIRAQVHVLDTSGCFLSVLGSEGTVMERGLRFLNPSGIATDGQGRMYVCDTKNCRIQILSAEGDLVLQFGRPLVVIGIHEEGKVAGFNYPRGVAVDEEEGLIYVADTGNNRLRSFNMQGKPVKTFGGHGERPGEFNAPLGLALDSQGRLYVADSQNHRIQVFERGFRFKEAFGRRGLGEGKFYHAPTSVAVSPSDELVVCDDSDRMHLLSGTGGFLGYIHGPRTGTVPPKYYAAAFSESGDIFAVDEHGCRLHHFAYRVKQR